MAATGTESRFFAPLYWTARRVVWWYLRAVHRLEIRGTENIPWRGPVILAANHCSFLDPPVVAMVSPNRNVRFMARDTLYSNPVARWFFPRVGLIALDRTRGDLAALRTAISSLKGGDVVALFPEGTRSPDGQLKEAKGGIGFLIAKSQAPVVPVRIFGTYEALPKGASRPRRARITVRVGSVITPDDIRAAMPDKSDYAAAAALVMQRIAALPPLAD